MKLFCWHKWVTDKHWERRCSKCGKEQHWRAMGNMCGGYVDGKRPPKPSAIPRSQRYIPDEFDILNETFKERMNR